MVIFERQAVIKLSETKDKDKRLLRNLRPKSLLNVDYKIISKLFCFQIEKVFPNLISSQQIVYVAERGVLTNQSRRLISDLLSMT